MRLDPFLGYRYDDPRADESIALGVMDLTSVIIGPGVVEPAATSGYGVTRFVDESSVGALAVFEAWVAEGVVSRDLMPSLYLYRSGTRDAEGVFHQGSGVIGLSGSSNEAFEYEPSVVNVDPPGLSELLGEITGQPLARATDSAGVHHRLWAITATSVIEAVNDSIADVTESPAGLIAVTPDAIAPPLGLVFNVASGDRQSN